MRFNFISGFKCPFLCLPMNQKVEKSAADLQFSDLVQIDSLDASEAKIRLDKVFLPSKTVKPKNLGLAFGIITPCSNVGVLADPYLAGLVKDYTGDYGFSFYLLSLFALLHVVTIGLFRLSKILKQKENTTGN